MLMLPLAIERRLAQLIDYFEIHARLPVAIEDAARRMGWELHDLPDITPIFGHVRCEADRRIITLNAALTPQARRTTIAHELGHWIAGHLQEGERRLSDAHSPMTEEEHEAWMVASMLLIPQAMLDADNLSALDIAARCDVPAWLVRLRLRATEG